MPAQRIPPQHLPHLQGKRWEALTHIGVAGREPHPHARGNRDHRRRHSARAATAAGSVAWSTAPAIRLRARSEEHTSELQSLMRISYAVFCLQKKTQPEHKSTPQKSNHY